jgi:chromosome partitioning protein
MTLILVHSPKGGVGSTFIAAQLALGLAQRGQEVAAIDCTYQDSLKLHFGLRPSQSLANVGEGEAGALVVSGVALMNGHALSRNGKFRDDPASVEATLFPQSRVTIVDVAAGDRDLKDRLMPFATLHVCVLMPTPAALSVLPRIEAGTPAVALTRSVFVLNQTDDRLRLSRHTQKFVRELFHGALIGTVRRDEAVNEALAMFEQIPRFAPASIVLADLAALIDAVQLRCGLAVDAALPVPVPVGGEQ